MCYKWQHNYLSLNQNCDIITTELSHLEKLIHLEKILEYY